jgi:alkanesulfonate monooxygenase SsuD/methylene tetrahydromethanopterin reductase-like flavin-dependent oxidoreductase (luciferase family)
MGSGLELGMHLPLLAFRGEQLSLRRLVEAVEAARDCGFSAISANDHFLFQAPWLDGPTALAAALPASGEMRLMTSVALVALRGPVPLAKALAALDVLSGGRVVAGVGPGSSARDYEAVDLPFDERWARFEAATATLRTLLRGDAPTLEPAPVQAGGVPVWIGSWGSPAGLRRVARLGDGWLASAYNTTPDRFGAARMALETELAARGRDAERFPNALATMWTWITDDPREADRVLEQVLAPLLGRDPEPLRDQLCVGEPGRCAELLSRYAQAGCQRVLLWPLGDEPRQTELAARDVLPEVGP